MTTFLKWLKNGNNLFLSILTLLLLFIVFWVLIRPSMIRKDCNIQAYAEAYLALHGKEDLKSAKMTYYKGDYDRYYESCLRGRGLQ